MIQSLRFIQRAVMTSLLVSAASACSDGRGLTPSASPTSPTSSVVTTQSALSTNVSSGAQSAASSYTPTLALTSSSAVTASAGGSSFQVAWTLSGSSSNMTIMPDVPWIVRSGTCTSSSGGMQDSGQGCVGTSGVGSYGRTWSATPNTSRATRTGHIALSVQGGNSVTVTVTQVSK